MDALAAIGGGLAVVLLLARLSSLSGTGAGQLLPPEPAPAGTPVLTALPTGWVATVSAVPH